ncbi:elongation factor Ts [Candidatus Bipolaricaulota bacterium]|jgi:elongation factor Ts|nr:elongation factor Ts [Candidatus Bipolaricaulota bacterium]
MTTIKIEGIRQLREETGIGMMDCKKALTEANDDIERAKEILREQGLELMEQIGREAHEGRIVSYVHHTGKVGVMVEMACNTDFAANGAEFIQLANDIAMHIASEAPLYVAPADVPEEDVEQKKAEMRKQMEEQGKPAEIIEKAVEGSISRFFKDACLIKQPFIKNPDVTIEDMLADLRTKTGENILVAQFSRFAIGEDENEA